MDSILHETGFYFLSKKWCLLIPDSVNFVFIVPCVTMLLLFGKREHSVLKKS